MAINNVNGSGNKPQLDSQKLSQQQTQNQTAAQTGAQKAAQTTTAPRADSVSLTQSAQQLNQLQRKNADAPVNKEKVDSLKKAIQNGEYRVDPDRLAQKIARLEAEVFGIKSK